MSETGTGVAARVPWKAVAVATAIPALLAVGVTQIVLPWILALPDEAGVGTPGALPTTPGADPLGGDAVAEAAPPTQRRLDDKSYLDGILARNLFDQSKIGVEAEEEEPTDDGVKVSDLGVTLKGTVVAVPASYSAAFIQESGKNRPYAYGIGQSILGAEVLEILDDRVRLRRNGSEEWLIMGEEGKGKPVASKEEPAGDESGEEIAQSGENSFTVERSFVEEQLSDLAGLSRMARALLHRGPDGDYDGYRLSAIRRGTLPDKLGIRNGDIIHSVNGLDLNSVDGAMRALEGLRTSPKLEFEVTRRGQPVTLSYEIR